MVHIDGDFSGEGVQELEHLIRSAEGPIAVDLSHLMYADSNGVEAIRTLQRAGAELRGVNAIVRFLLRDATH